MRERYCNFLFKVSSRGSFGINPEKAEIKSFSRVHPIFDVGVQEPAKNRSKKGNGFSPQLKITKFAYFLTENLLFTHQNIVGPYIVIHGWKDIVHMDILVPRLRGLVMIF